MFYYQILTPSGYPPRLPRKGDFVYSANLSIPGGWVFPNRIDEVVGEEVSRSEVLHVTLDSGLTVLIPPDQAVLVDGCCWVKARSLSPGTVVTTISSQLGALGLILTPSQVTVVSLWSPLSAESIEFFSISCDSSKGDGDADTNTYFLGDEKGGILVHGGVHGTNRSDPVVSLADGGSGALEGA